MVEISAIEDPVMTDINEILPFVYLCIFLVLLGTAALFVFRQILKTRRAEGNLSKLETKLSQEKGTAQEYYELGGIYLDKKLFSQAVNQFQRALKADGLEQTDLPRIYNALGYAYAAQEQYDLAIRQYREALKLIPNYVVALNNLGFAYERKQLLSQALESYQDVLKADPQNSTAKRRAESLSKRLPA